ncbi:MAG: hypothetical protein ACLGH6_09520 [Gammaproteobacteria bacterium]
MKFALPVKLTSVTALVLAGIIGCAAPSQQQVAEKPAAAPSAAASQALNDASAAIKQAKSLDWIWRDTEKMYKEAEEAAKAGDDAKAIKLAGEAKYQAEAAVNQYYIEQSKTMLGALQAKRNLTAAEKSKADAAAAALSKAQGKQAYDILTKS